MKCRACWSDKAYLREVKGWRGVALNWLGIVPLKCHHCYHKSWAFFLQAWGTTTHTAAADAAVAESGTWPDRRRRTWRRFLAKRSLFQSRLNRTAATDGGAATRRWAPPRL